MRKTPLARRGVLTVTILALSAVAAACSASPGSASPGSPSSGASGGPVTTPVSTAPTGTAKPGTEVSGTLTDGTSWVAEYPAAWNGTLVLYSHGFGSLTASDAPDSQTQSALLAAGYAIAGSSYDPNGSEWALDTALSDQFGALAAVESTVLPRPPAQVLAFGTSMGGLISALEAQDGQGKINGALTTCGVVSGGVNLSQYQLDGEYAITRLLGNPATQLVGLNDDTAYGTGLALYADVQQAQGSAAGRARVALAMAFFNMPDWNPYDPAPAAASDPAAQEAAQYAALMDSTTNVISFYVGGRESIEQAAGGQPAWTAGTNFAQLFAASSDKAEVTALYQAAKLNLSSDLATLSARATIKATPAALRSLQASSDPTGKLEVPELDLHTIGDNLVPVKVENYYAKLVDQAGSGGLLRQAYTDSFGHCNFSVSEELAGLDALSQRVTTGQWGDLATAASLEGRATALHLDSAHFISYSPGELTGAVP
jgi:hypothetical protein